jgi:hypothetical protein
MLSIVATTKDISPIISDSIFSRFIVINLTTRNYFQDSQ